MRRPSGVEGGRQDRADSPALDSQQGERRLLPLSAHQFHVQPWKIGRTLTFATGLMNGVLDLVLLHERRLCDGVDIFSWKQ